MKADKSDNLAESEKSRAKLLNKIGSILLF